MKIFWKPVGPEKPRPLLPSYYISIKEKKKSDPQHTTIIKQTPRREELGRRGLSGTSEDEPQSAGQSAEAINRHHLLTVAFLQGVRLIRGRLYSALDKETGCLDPKRLSGVGRGGEGGICCSKEQKKGSSRR